MRRTWFLPALLFTGLGLLANTIRLNGAGLVSGAGDLLTPGAAGAAGTTSAPAQEPSPPAEPAAPLDPAAGALRVFKRRCVDCHGRKAGPDYVKFNYIEDLARVAGNKKFIVAGNAEKSKLYQYVAHTKKPYMPAKREPLTPEELAAVKTWIDSLAVPQK